MKGNTFRETTGRVPEHKKKSRLNFRKKTRRNSSLISHEELLKEFPKLHVRMTRAILDYTLPGTPKKEILDESYRGTPVENR